MATLSHDLRTPITAILMSADLIAQNETLSEGEQELVDSIRSSAGRATRMIEQLLDFTRVRLTRDLELNLVSSDLFAVAGEIIRELRRAHPQASIHLHTDGELRGMWDADRIARVIMNLVGNAVQHGDVSRPIRVELVRDADAACLSVTNHGAPIPPERTERMFEPFARGSEASSGYGLGLYIVRRIVDAHRGTIVVSSTADSTSFRIALPITTSVAPSGDSP